MAYSRSRPIRLDLPTALWQLKVVYRLFLPKCDLGLRSLHIIFI